MKTILAISLSLIATSGASLNAQTRMVRITSAGYVSSKGLIGSNTIIKHGHGMETMGPAIRVRLRVAPGETDSIELKVITKINFLDIDEPSYSIMYTYGPKAYSSAQSRKHTYTFKPDGTIESGLK